MARKLEFRLSQIKLDIDEDLNLIEKINIFIFHEK